MSDKNETEPKDATKPTEPRPFNIFNDRIWKQYTIETKLALQISDIMQKIWKDVAPNYGVREEMSMSLNENGQTIGTMPFWLLLLALASFTTEVMREVLLQAKPSISKKTLEKTLSSIINEKIMENLPRLIPPDLKRCPKCNHDNDKYAKYCNTCGNELK